MRGFWSCLGPIASSRDAVAFSFPRGAHDVEFHFCGAFFFLSSPERTAALPSPSRLYRSPLSFGSTVDGEVFFFFSSKTGAAAWHLGPDLFFVPNPRYGLIFFFFFFPRVENCLPPRLVLLARARAAHGIPISSPLILCSAGVPSLARRKSRPFAAFLILDRATCPPSPLSGTKTVVGAFDFCFFFSLWAKAMRRSLPFFRFCVESARLAAPPFLCCFFLPTA